MLAFGLNGAVTLITAMVYAELTSTIPGAGGGYAYVKHAFPDIPGFTAGWWLWFAYTVACALYAAGFGSYFMEFPCKYTVEFLIDIAAALAIQKDGIVVGLTVVKDDTGQHIVRANSVAAGIARAANSYDMVVIGAAPPQFFKHMLLGDIPEKVARHSSSPVIIIQKWQGSVSGLFRKLFG